MIVRRIILATMIAAMPLALGAQETPGLETIEPGAGPVAAGRKAVVLGTLDKITARVSELEAPIDEPITFGTLEITARACNSTPPEEPPETSAFLEVREMKRGESPTTVFVGWMFASSPALSALEHPVYDVWVLSCTALSPETEDGSAKKSPEDETASLSKS